MPRQPRVVAHLISETFPRSSGLIAGQSVGVPDLSTHPLSRLSTESRMLSNVGAMDFREEQNASTVFNA